MSALWCLHAFQSCHRNALWRWSVYRSVWGTLEHTYTWHITASPTIPGGWEPEWVLGTQQTLAWVYLKGLQPEETFAALGTAEQKQNLAWDCYNSVFLCVSEWNGGQSDRSCQVLRWIIRCLQCEAYKRDELKIQPALRASGCRRISSAPLIAAEQRPCWRECFSHQLHLQVGSHREENTGCWFWMPSPQKINSWKQASSNFLSFGYNRRHQGPQPVGDGSPSSMPEAFLTGSHLFSLEGNVSLTWQRTLGLRGVTLQA